jgi:FlaA1/EpsC-like NDP-sugar epimerase
MVENEQGVRNMGGNEAPGTQAVGSIWRRVARAIKTIALDLSLILVALTTSVSLVQGFSNFAALLEALTDLAPTVLGASLIAILSLRLYRIEAKYVGLYDIMNLTWVAVAATLGLAVSLGFLAPHTFDRSAGALLALNGLLALALLTTCRVAQRVHASGWLAPPPRSSRQRRALIVGAGDAGESLLREVAKLDPPEHAVLGFVDPDPSRHGSTIHGLPVFGGIDEITGLSQRFMVEDILVAMPEASSEEMRQIFNQAVKTTARVRTMPALSRFMLGGANVLPLMREVNVEDLLSRASVREEMAPVARYLSGERVLITGGGGSIGSELARQVARLSPASLILVGKGENSIFEIDQELREKFGFAATPVICDIRDQKGVEAIFALHRPSIVFHAAAHKHVPLMEAVPIEAVRNNVFGTLNMAECAIRNGIQKFILVSTDKAVNPSNVMGATKRVAEMIVSALATRTETSFSAVRFGNVLGSRGSLIPILKRQISSGGPVTVTHPDMTRFFMTIPEAVQLIVKAGAMGERGEIYILDMGEPVSIDQLARDMIRLHGLVPGRDIEVKYTGIRPGEKLREELVYDAEDLKPSHHAKIRVVSNQQPIDWEWLKERLGHLEDLCSEGDSAAVRAFLMELAWGKSLPPVPTKGV